MRTLRIRSVRDRGGRCSRAFTLIELVLLIAVIGVMTVAAVRVATVSRSNIDAVSKLLRSDLQLAQDLAMTNGASYGFHATSATAYRIFAGSPGTPARHPLTSGNFEVSIAPNQFVGSVPTVTFQGSGQPTLAADALIPITNGTATITVRVARTTGYVTIE